MSAPPHENPGDGTSASSFRTWVALVVIGATVSAASGIATGVLPIPAILRWIAEQWRYLAPVAVGVLVVSQMWVGVRYRADRRAGRDVGYPLAPALLVGLAAGVAVTFVVATLVAHSLDPQTWWLFQHDFRNGGRDWYDIARSTVALVGGIGLGIGLILAYRRQRTSEAAQRVREAAQQHERDTEQYRRERELERLEEDREKEQHRRDRELADSAAHLYNSAIEQLGHERPAVRTAAMYTLDRLGQQHPDYRQNVIDVWCSYLRTPNPLVLHTRLRDDLQARTIHAEARAQRMAGEQQRLDDARAEAKSLGQPYTDAMIAAEAEVRDAALRLLCTRLQLSDGTIAGQRGWSDAEQPLSVDLTNAHLHNARFTTAYFPGHAVFDGATFTGTAWFEEATFSGDARFEEATFSGTAWFEEATFSGEVWFEEATFSGTAWFRGTKFLETAWFMGTKFSGSAWFTGTDLAGPASFDGAVFSGAAHFSEANFSRSASFTEAQFVRQAGFVDTKFSQARFERTRFSGDAVFRGTEFSGDALFEGATFSTIAWFGAVRFSGDARFAGATFAEPWFEGARFSRTASFEQATLSGHARFGGAKFSGDTRFTGARFSWVAWFGNTTFSAPVAFDGTTFSGPLDLRGAAFQSGGVSIGDAHIACRGYPVIATNAATFKDPGDDPRLA